jgi:hypothetical protein
LEDLSNFKSFENSGGTPDSFNYQISVQGSIDHVSASAFYDSQTESPVFAPVQSSQPNLREVLLHQSEIALSPTQMAQFVREASPLVPQGYVQSVTVGVASQRAQYGGTIDYSTDRIGHVAVNGIVDTSEGGSVPSLRLTTAGVVWTRKVGRNNSLNTGLSMYHTVSAGQASTQPVMQFSLQHQLSSVPRWLAPGRRGTIQGHVFMDKELAQNYSPGVAPLASVTISLDGHRTTQTASDGTFVFHAVPYGLHRVEADYHDPRAFYFTSSSPKSVEAGGTADFGISFATGHIFGTSTDDTGTGLQANFTLQGNAFNGRSAPMATATSRSMDYPMEPIA